MTTEKYDEIMEKYEEAARLGKCEEIALQSSYDSMTVYLTWEADPEACDACREHHGETRKAGDWDVKPPLHPNCRCYFTVDRLEFMRPFAKRIVFDGRRLIVYDQFGAEMYRTQAESGMPGYQEPGYQDLKSTGPLPEGAYTLHPDELSDPNFLSDIKRNLTGDWGDWRVRLHEKDPTLGRSNFFLHGGIRSGTKGCIEFEGFSDAELLRLIEESPFDIEVDVDYGNDLACTP